MTLSGPISGAAVTDPQVTYSWSGGYTGGSVTYDLQVSQSIDVSTSPLIDKTGLGNSYTPSDFPLQNDETIYYWRVRAVDGAFTGDWTTPESFSLDTRVALIGPSGTILTTQPTIDWQDSIISNAAYAVQVASNIDFTNIVESATSVGISTHTVAATLPNNTTYYYRVAVIDANATQWDWSSTGSFYLQMPVVTYNGNGNTGGTVPVDSNAYYEVGATVTVLGNTESLVKLQDGIQALFTGWDTNSDGSGMAYTASDVFSIGSNSVTLYAQWSLLGATGPAGGYIFYDAGSVQAWGRYLEAAPADLSASQVWIEGGATQETLNGNTSTAIGTGQANTDAIVAQIGHTGSAAKLCLDYNYGGYDDWFLPSRAELNLVYQNKDVVGGFAAAVYWSSSEHPAINAWRQNFNLGDQGNANKYNGCRVRSVRAF